MISWQQWSKRWGSWSGWRANCPTFRQDAGNSRPGVMEKEQSPKPSDATPQRLIWQYPGRKRTINYFSTTFGRRI
jgi:hypothetical protein